MADERKLQVTVGDVIQALGYLEEHPTKENLKDPSAIYDRADAGKVIKAATREQLRAARKELSIYKPEGKAKGGTVKKYAKGGGVRKPKKI